MGQLSVPSSGEVYVDANALIYRVERIEPYLTASAPLWDALDQGTVQVQTSELTLLEVLVKPLRDGNAALVTLFRAVLLGTVGLRCLPVSLRILELAAELRAQHGVKTPDAIHAASALVHGAVLFVTNDVGFRRVPKLPVVVLSEVAASWRRSLECGDPSPLLFFLSRSPTPNQALFSRPSGAGGATSPLCFSEPGRRMPARGPGRWPEGEGVRWAVGVIG
jgi:predicted nucleic acid-binding protein